MSHYKMSLYKQVVSLQYVYDGRHKFLFSKINFQNFLKSLGAKEVSN